jgi:hypothetical protein
MELLGGTSSADYAIGLRQRGWKTCWKAYKCLCSGAGGNRTPVHQPLSDRDTTIPAVVLTQHHRRVDYPLRDRGTTFRAVIGLSRRHQSFPMSFPASVAGLR